MGILPGRIIRQRHDPYKHFPCERLRATIPGMRVLVISDVHANITALEAVLDAARPFQALWCLGDTVGYGPDPNECVELVRSFPNLTSSPHSFGSGPYPTVSPRH